MLGAAITLAAALLCVPTLVTGQVSSAERPALLRKLTRGDGGIGTWVEAARTKLRKDTAVIRFYEDLYHRRVVVTERWEPSAVLWWLAESEQPRFLPLFKRISLEMSQRAEAELFAVAVYGLLKLAPAEPAALRHLDSLATHGNRFELTGLATVATYMNDDTARQLLRRIPREEIRWVELYELIPKVLAGGAAPRDRARWPCGSGTSFLPDAQGAWGCR